MESEASGSCVLLVLTGDWSSYRGSPRFGVWKTKKRIRIVDTSSKSWEALNIWFTPDSHHLVVKDRQSGVLAIWSTANGERIETIRPTWHTHPARKRSWWRSLVRISPDSKTVAVNVHGEVRLFDLTSGRCFLLFPRSGHAGQVQTLAVMLQNGRSWHWAGH